MEPISVAPTPELVPVTAIEHTSAQKKEQTKLPALKVKKPVRPSGKTLAVKIRANGLLDVKDPPSYLIPAIKRNATESPLLRLGANIRMKIWKYALGGRTIQIKARKVPDTPAFDTGSQYSGKVVHHGPKRAQPKTAFRLPEVSRLIYQETATLGYAANQFAFVGEVDAKFGRESGPDGALEGWCRELVPAQIHAVNSIRPHWHDLQDYLNKNSMRAFKHLFPNLKQIRVPSRAVNCDAKWPRRSDPMRKHLRQQAKDRIAAMVKEQEGRDVEVIFSGV